MKALEAGDMDYKEEVLAIIDNYPLETERKSEVETASERYALSIFAEKCISASACCCL